MIYFSDELRATGNWRLASASQTLKPVTSPEIVDDDAVQANILGAMPLGDACLAVMQVLTLSTYAGSAYPR